MSCGKTEFESERAAKRALRSIRSPHGRMHVYRCGGHWHIGHGNKIDRAHAESQR